MTNPALPEHWRNSLNALRPTIAPAFHTVMTAVEEQRPLTQREVFRVQHVMLIMAKLLASTLPGKEAEWFIGGIVDD